MRVLPAGLVLLVVSAVIKPWRPHGSEWWRTTKLAIFNFGIFFPLLSVAVYRLPGGVASAVGGLQPLFVATLSRPLAGNVPRQWDLVVGSVAAIGVCLVAIHPGADLDPVGLLAAVGARGDPVATHGRCRRRSAVAVGTQSGRLRVPQPHWHGAGIRGVVQRHPPASRGCPTTAGLAAPVTGAVLGWAILDQSLTPLQLVGFAIAIGSIVYGASTGASGARVVVPQAPRADRLRRSSSNRAAASTRARWSPSRYPGWPLRGCATHRSRSLLRVRACARWWRRP